MINKLKKSIALGCIYLFMSTSVSSCYVHNYQVGEGAQGKAKTKKKNHYLIGGLIPLSRANTNKVVGDENDYDIKSKKNVSDVVLTFITFGIYTPTTTLVYQ